MTYRVMPISVNWSKTSKTFLKLRAFFKLIYCAETCPDAALELLIINPLIQSRGKRGTCLFR